MARQKPAGLLGIHVNMPATVPADVAKGAAKRRPGTGRAVREGESSVPINDLYTKGGGYAGIMVTRPQTLGYGLSDSPAGLAAFFYDKFNDWTYSGGDAEKALTRDEMLDDITLYWLTNTAASSARLYWENNNNNFNAVEQKTADISIPKFRLLQARAAGLVNVLPWASRKLAPPSDASTWLRVVVSIALSSRSRSWAAARSQ
jgi:hypothetical protein